MKNNNFLLGFIAGITTGTLLGILFAPEKESDIRKKIAQKKDILLDDLKTNFNKVSKNVEELVPRRNKIPGKFKSTISQINKNIIEN